MTSGPYDVQVVCDHNHVVTVNGITASSNGATSGNAVFTVYGVSTVTNVTVNATGSRPDLTSISINGSILVDASVYNASQNWSNGITAGSEVEPGSTLTNAFDGQTTNTSPITYLFWQLVLA